MCTKTIVLLWQQSNSMVRSCVYAKSIDQERVVFVVDSVDLRYSFGVCKRLSANKRWMLSTLFP